MQVFDDARRGLALANGTHYALVAGVFTRDFATAHRLARDIDAGQVYINEYFAGGIEMPFGGNRRSGFGREKGLEGAAQLLQDQERGGAGLRRHPLCSIKAPRAQVRCP